MRCSFASGVCFNIIILQAFVHVSTAYSNSDRQEVKEVVYPTAYQPGNIISLINWLPDDMLDKVSIKKHIWDFSD